MRARVDLRAALDEEREAGDRMRDDLVRMRGENEALRERLVEAEDRLRGVAATLLKAARRIQGLEAQVARGQEVMANIMQFQEYNRGGGR